QSGSCVKQIVDSDGDGLPDSSDLCAQEAGSMANYGCPASKCIDSSNKVQVKVNHDKDNDGIDDACDGVDNTPECVQDSDCIKDPAKTVCSNKICVAPPAPDEASLEVKVEPTDIYGEYKVSWTANGVKDGKELDDAYVYGAFNRIYDGEDCTGAF